MGSVEKLMEDNREEANETSYNIHTSKKIAPFYYSKMCFFPNICSRICPVMPRYLQF